jgi:hypothetical protein
MEGEGNKDQKEVTGKEPKHSLASLRTENQEEQPVEKRDNVPAFLGEHGQEQGEERGKVQRKKMATADENPCPAEKRQKAKERTEEARLVRDDADRLHVSGMGEEEEGPGKHDRTSGRRILVLREEHGQKDEEEHGVPNMKEKALDTVRPRGQPECVVAQGVQENGHGSVIRQMNSEFRATRDMEIAVGEKAGEILPLKSPLAGIVQDDSVLIPQERTEQGLTIQEQAKGREHEGQEQQKGNRRKGSRWIRRMVPVLRKDAFPCHSLDPLPGCKRESQQATNRNDPEQPGLKRDQPVIPYATGIGNSRTNRVP